MYLRFRIDSETYMYIIKSFSFFSRVREQLAANARADSHVGSARPMQRLFKINKWIISE